MSARSQSLLADMARHNPVPSVTDREPAAVAEAEALLQRVLASPRSVPPGQPIAWDRGRATTRRRARLAIVLTVAAAGLVVAVVLAETQGAPSTRGRTTVATSTTGRRGAVLDVPAWRLVSSVTSPFRSLPAGGQPNLQCATDAVCYSPGSASQGGQLIRTADGGATWHATESFPVPVSTAFDCVGVDFCAVLGSTPNPAPGVVVDVETTTGGGTNWHTAPVPQPSGMTDASASQIACADASHCVVNVTGTPPGAAGSSGPPVGTFESTSDEGATWRQATTVPATSAAGGAWTMTCSTGGSCLALIQLAGHPDQIAPLHSNDNGITWTAGTALPLGAGGGLLYASCGDPTHCLVVMVGGPTSRPYEIVQTKDAGATWQTSGPPAGWENMPTAAACATGQDCWIAMSTYDATSPFGSYRQPVVEATDDGGATWTPMALPAATPAIADVLTLSCPPSGDGCMGIGNLADHFALPARPPKRPTPLSGPLVISSLPGGAG